MIDVNLQNPVPASSAADLTASLRSAVYSATK